MKPDRALAHTILSSLEVGDAMPLDLSGFWRMEAPQEPDFISLREGACWICIHTNPRWEFSVEDDLKKLGYEVFLPRARKWSTHARKKTETISPLFTGYLFVLADLARQGIYDIKKTDGVECVLSNNGLPMSVTQSLIDELRSAQEIGVFDETKAVTRLAPGDSVRIVKGPFADFIGTLQAANNRKRVEVLLSLFGRLTVNAMPLSWVRPA